MRHLARCSNNTEISASYGWQAHTYTRTHAHKITKSGASPNEARAQRHLYCIQRRKCGERQQQATLAAQHHFSLSSQPTNTRTKTPACKHLGQTHSHTREQRNNTQGKPLSPRHAATTQAHWRHLATAHTLLLLLLCSGWAADGHTRQGREGQGDCQTHRDCVPKKESIAMFGEPQPRQMAGQDRPAHPHTTASQC